MVIPTKTNTSQDGQAFFNMSIATLMRLDAILTEIKEISTRFKGDKILSYAESLEIKRSLVRQFYIQSRPLLKLEHRDPAKEMVDNIPETFTTKKIFSETPGKIKEIACIGNKIADYYMDRCLEFIQDKLQERGVFMPANSDPRFAFARLER